MAGEREIMGESERERLLELGDDLRVKEMMG